jgi:hypothetical protein
MPAATGLLLPMHLLLKAGKLRCEWIKHSCSVKELEPAHSWKLANIHQWLPQMSKHASKSSRNYCFDVELPTAACSTSAATASGRET